MPQLDTAVINGFVRGADGQLVKQKVLKPPIVDQYGNVVEQEDWEYQKTIPGFDIGKPPTLSLAYKEFPKVLYRSSDNLAVPADTMQVKGPQEEAAALAAGWQLKPHILQPPCTATFEDENQLIHCELHIHHDGRHRNGDFIWRDGKFNSPVPMAETREAAVNRQRTKRYADGTLSPDAASVGLKEE